MNKNGQMWKEFLNKIFFWARTMARRWIYGLGTISRSFQILGLQGGHFGPPKNVKNRFLWVTARQNKLVKLVVFELIFCSRMIFDGMVHILVFGRHLAPQKMAKINLQNRSKNQELQKIAKFTMNSSFSTKTLLVLPGR